MDDLTKLASALRPPADYFAGTGDEPWCWPRNLIAFARQTRHTTLNTFALCDTHHLPRKKLSCLNLLGEPGEALADLDLRIAGVNHFTFVPEARLRGVDVLPRLADAFRAASAAAAIGSATPAGPDPQLY